MRKTALAVLLLAALLATPAPAPASDEWRSCRPVAFTPNSDDAASSIRAKNVSCRYTRRFIRETDGRPPARRDGWRCTRRVVDDTGLAYTQFRCIRGERVMRWRRY